MLLFVDVLLFGVIAHFHFLITELFSSLCFKTVCSIVYFDFAVPLVQQFNFFKKLHLTG